jgi:hypothetical protein
VPETYHGGPHIRVILLAALIGGLLTLSQHAVRPDSDPPPPTMDGDPLVPLASHKTAANPRQEWATLPGRKARETIRYMDRSTDDPGPSRFWYSVVFVAGVYWGVSLVSGTLDHSLMLWGPIVLCLSIAIVVIGHICWRILEVTLNLCAMFCIGLALGYELQSSGALEFLREHFRIGGLVRTAMGARNR